MKNLNFETMMEFVKSLNDEQKSQLREAMGISAAKPVSLTRIGGKFTRTDKVLKVKVARQMQQLIDVLPTDRAVDVNEWTKLAVDAGLQTQQEPVRITAYYKKAILDGGYATQQ